MIVVADTSPLIVLVKLAYADVLPHLFRSIVVPPAVAAELDDLRRPQLIRDFIANLPPWLLVRQPSAIESIPELDEGERQAISLARELGADLLLMDEEKGRAAARRRALRVTGTVGILERAAARGLLDLDDAFARLKGTDFWISHRLLAERLGHFRRGRERRGGKGGTR
jgi:predicted nucleic acid-binding protein